MNDQESHSLVERLSGENETVEEKPLGTLNTLIKKISGGSQRNDRVEEEELVHGSVKAAKLRIFELI